MNQIHGIGIDAGSTTCKIAAVDHKGDLLTWRVVPAHPLVEKQSEQLLAELLAQYSSMPEVPVIATGYGRKLIKRANRQVTEISCHARGVFHALGCAGTLIDIGGQDSKVIVVGQRGQVLDFIMNDKCAAGTGRFLEHTAARLDVALDQLGPRALASPHEENISSTCTVFAESEIISLVAYGVAIDAILRGLHRALASRIASMLHSLSFSLPLMLSGGGALNSALHQILSEILAEPIRIPQQPQLMGALGAAIFAQDQCAAG